MGSRPIVLAREKAQERADATGQTYVVWKDHDGNFYVTPDGAAQPDPAAWRYEIVRSRGEPVKKIEQPRVPGMAIFARKIRKNRP